MNKKYIVRQNGYKDCGPSCLLSIFKYYGLDVSHEELSLILKTNIDGTNAYNIINGSRTFGFDGYGSHYTYEQIINNDISFPIICHVMNNNYYHFIVIYKVTKKYLIIMDPASNINKITHQRFKEIYLNTSIVIYPIKEIHSSEKHDRLFNYILRYIKTNKIKTIKVIFLSLLIISLSILINYYSLICIDILLPNYNFKVLIEITILFLITYISSSILSFIRDKYLIDIETNISIKIHEDIIRKVFNLPYQFFKNKSTGEIMSRLNDLKAFKDILSNLIVNVSTDIILIIISMIILLKLNIKLFLINIIEIILYLILNLLYKHTYLYKTEEILEYEGKYNKTLNESINGYENNKNLNLLNETIDKININNNIYENKTKSYKNITINHTLLKNVIMNITYILTIFISTILINNNTITIGEFILFTTILYYFSEPMKNILDLNKNIIYLNQIYNRINDLIMIKSKEIKYINYDLKGDIVINDLSYNNLFNQINLTIKFEEKILIYGDSGIGKSTLMKILLKYIKEYEGEILINNINIKDIDDNSILKSITYVSQNSFLNNDTLINNIIYDRNIKVDEYEKVLEICNLKKLRDNNINRNNFIVEDNGFNVSGGERQKIILARSLLKNSEYYIFDESLSEVSVDEEKEIIDKLMLFLKEKTVIYISHKREIIDYFDKKYKLERGKKV